MKEYSNLEEQLNDPFSKEIIQTHSEVEFDRRESMYQKLKEDHPSLGEMFKEKPSTSSLDVIEKAEPMMQVLTSSKDLLKSTISMLPKELKEDPEFKKVQNSLESFDYFCEVQNKVIPMIKQYYANLVDTVQNVAYEVGVTSLEVVKEQHYMDKVSRKIFPTREEAEDFVITSASYVSDVLTTSKNMMTLSGQLGQMDTKTLEHLQSFPTDEAIEALSEASLEFAIKEFDRIYAKE